MLSFDANLILYSYSYSKSSPYHEATRKFIEGVFSGEDVALSEVVLTGFYLLSGNPVVLSPGGMNPPPDPTQITLADNLNFSQDRFPLS